MNPTITELLKAAEKKGIKVESLSKAHESEFLELTYLNRKKIINKTKSPFLSAINAKLSSNKFLTSEIMQKQNLPIVPKILTTALSKQEYDFLDHHNCVLLKPNQCDRGVGIYDFITTRFELENAFSMSREFKNLLLEKQIFGKEYRIFIIDQKVHAVIERKPLKAVGDGKSTIKELIENLNQDVRRGHIRNFHVLRPIEIHKIRRHLIRQGFSLESILSDLQPLQLSFSNHLDSGGVACDQTDRIHDDFVKMSIQAANLIGIDVAGIDIICSDISKSKSANQEIAILEVNPGPDILWHIYPAEGASRPLAELYLDYIFS